MMIGTSIFAQTITGTVSDAQTGQPLPGANIVQVETSNGVSADTSGHFSLDLLKNRSTEIKVTFVGYKTRTIDTQKQGQTLQIKMVPKAIMSNEVFVKALRVNEATPMAYENVTRDEIKSKNLGQDIPYMLSGTPSVTTTSDAGTGIGYSSMRIRGVDQKRINVTINGIPVNDAESQGVFWVDMPDLASSVENIQIQRGVGTSTNGAGAFGATVNIQTDKMQPEAYGEVNTSVGSFNTRKANVKLGSGLMKNGWQFEGRLSKVASDGYIDRAWSNLKSFYLSAAKHGDRSLLRADVFSGREHTYQAWYGVPESKLKQGDRTYNPAGMEKPGDPYDNETDNYQQDHYQLHYSYQLMGNWNANVSLHYTYGRGYYEEYKADQALTDYGIDPVQMPDTTIKKTDLIRDLWLRNDFYGVVYSTDYQADQWSLAFGGAYNEYDGDHYGDIQWARYASDSEINQKYYNNNAFKTDFNSYLKAQYHITKKLNAYGDAQIRHITYSFLGKDKQKAQGGGEKIVDVKQEARLTFFNPKGGLTYNFNDRQRAYLSLSVGNKEPTRDEYVNSTPENRPKPETLYDWEAGYKGAFRGFFGGVNLYYMDYKNQLILTGELNDVGAYIRQNVPDSYRAGIELQAGVQILPSLKWSANATFSRNKIKNYTYFLDNYDTGKQKSMTYKNTDISFSPDFIADSRFQFNMDGFSAQLNTKYVGREYLDNTQKMSRSLDPYFVNDLRLNYDWSRSPIAQSINVTLQINNLFDEMYISNGATYGHIANGTQHFTNYYYPQAGRNFLLQLSLKF